jgi:hypothetical protein
VPTVAQPSAPREEMTVAVLLNDELAALELLELELLEVATELLELDADELAGAGLDEPPPPPPPHADSRATTASAVRLSRTNIVISIVLCSPLGIGDLRPESSGFPQEARRKIVKIISEFKDTVVTGTMSHRSIKALARVNIEDGPAGTTQALRRTHSTKMPTCVTLCTPANWRALPGRPSLQPVVSAFAFPSPACI